MYYNNLVALNGAVSHSGDEVLEISLALACETVCFCLMFPEVSRHQAFEVSIFTLCPERGIDHIRSALPRRRVILRNRKASAPLIPTPQRLVVYHFKVCHKTIAITGRHPNNGYSGFRYREKSVPCPSLDTWTCLVEVSGSRHECVHRCIHALLVIEPSTTRTKQGLHKGYPEPIASFRVGVYGSG